MRRLYWTLRRLYWSWGWVCHGPKFWNFGIGLWSIWGPCDYDDYHLPFEKLIDQHRKGADTSKIKLQFVINNGPGGKTIIVQEQAIEPGQPIPDLSHFGQTPLTPMELIEGFKVRR